MFERRKGEKKSKPRFFQIQKGRVSEWFKEAVLKTVDAARYPGVRIPPLPFIKNEDCN